jgi:hypothetical protein
MGCPPGLARVPMFGFPYRSCATGFSKYRHFRLEYQEQTLCRRALENFHEPPDSRPICLECRSTMQYLARHRPEGKIDTLRALAR